MMNNIFSHLPSAGKLSPLMIAMLALAGPVRAETQAKLAGASGSDAPQDIATNVQFDSTFLQLQDSQAMDQSRYRWQSRRRKTADDAERQAGTGF